MTKKSIHEAITAVLKESNTALSPKELYEKISARNYYSFKSKNPIAIISGELRKRCEGSKTLKGKAIYKKTTNGQYILI